MPLPRHEVLRLIRSKLHFAAALALKNDIDLTAEIIKIFGYKDTESQRMIETPIESKSIIESDRLSPREKLVLETIYGAIKPVSINEMVDQFKGNSVARWSKSSITQSVKVLQRMDLIGQANTEEGIQGYARLG